MELRHLRYFVAVAEELHFGRAAERLVMAQPPLSQQIRQLEDEIGVLLFERTNRRVQLTEGGRVFLTEARAILDRVDRAVRTAQRAARGEIGWLGIGFVASATYSVLPDILRQFRERFPDVELELHELLGVEQGQALRDRRIHVGFSRLPRQEDGIVLETVTREPMLVALPATHRLSGQKTVRLEELASEPFIQFPPQPQSTYAAFVLRLCQQAGFAPRMVQKAGEIETAVSLVTAGIGVALVPASVQNLRRDGVVYRPIVDPAPIVELTMAYRDGDTSPVLPQFLEIVRKSVQERQAW